jgi:hypothetical protein
MAKYADLWERIQDEMKLTEDEMRQIKEVERLTAEWGNFAFSEELDDSPPRIAEAFIKFFGYLIQSLEGQPVLNKPELKASRLEDGRRTIRHLGKAERIKSYV